MDVTRGAHATESRNGLTMRELFPDLFMETLTFRVKAAGTMNLFFVRSEDRSLMVDTGFDFPETREAVEAAFRELSLEYEKTDLFITHSHADHMGLAPWLAQKGVRVLAGLDPTRVYSLYRNVPEDSVHSGEKLTMLGVDAVRLPELRAYYDRMEQPPAEPFSFPFTRVQPGDRLFYGKYAFTVLGLTGHTWDQIGLYDDQAGIVFSADQVLSTTVPFVDSLYRDEKMLDRYISSLQNLRHNFRGYTLLPAHHEILYAPGPVIEDIIYQCEGKCELVYRALAVAGKPVTAYEAARAVYALDELPQNDEQLTHLSMILARTFTCLEYLYGQRLIYRREEPDGMLFWRI